MIVYNFEYGDVEKYSFRNKIPAGIYESPEIDFVAIDYPWYENFVISLEKADAPPFL